MTEEIKKDLDAAKKLLQSEFQTLVEDGQLIGMRNMRIAFAQWAQKMNDKGEMKFSPEQVDLFMSTYIEELEKQRSKNEST